MAKPPVIVIKMPARSGFERVLPFLTALTAVSGLVISARMARRAMKADESKETSIDDARIVLNAQIKT